MTTRTPAVLNGERIIQLKEIRLFPHIKIENGKIQDDHYKFCSGVDFFRMKMNCFVFCHHPATRPPFIRHYILWHNFQTFFPRWNFPLTFDNFIWCQNVQAFLSFNFQHKDFWVKLNLAAQLFKAPEEIANSLKSNQRKSLHPSTDIFIYHFGERSRPTKVLGLFAIWLSCWYPSNVLLLICKC